MKTELAGTFSIVMISDDNNSHGIYQLDDHTKVHNGIFQPNFIVNFNCKPI